MDERESMRDLRRIPGVGPRMAEDLLRLGYRRVAELAGADPQQMYERLMALEGCHVDRCVLYVFRCAQYFARTEGQARDPELLKWWNWKDGQ
ncbi:DUF4332 domain-containing protein [Desulfocurvus vexinensis]|uniref:DUF4332 domain-containing protein n=1 Tax=Desulfocurvus vexinensis TaxID=399548 RepID=UPI0004903709|nr:DUF4332 domain-containing protein [Desulfocurvus vexinensis]